MRYLAVLAIIIFIILIIGCEHKTSSVGKFDSKFDIFTDTLRVSDNIFQQLRSYSEDMYTLFDYPPFVNLIDNAPMKRQRLYVGKYKDIESRILLRFPNFPDSLVTIVEKPTITLTIIENHNMGDNAKLKYALLTKEFDEVYASWDSTGVSEYWDGGDFIGEKEVTKTDSLRFVFEIEESVVNSWMENKDTNYGIILMSDEDDKYLSFNNVNVSSLASRPRLTYKYLGTENDTIGVDIIFSESTIIYKHNSLIKNDIDIFFSNIYPKSIYAQLSITDSLFRHRNIMSVEDLNRVNILNAHLVFKVKESTIVESDSTYYGFISAMPPNNPDNKFKYDRHTPYNTSRNNRTVWKKDNNELSISITSIFQNIINQRHLEQDICLINIYRGMDFSFINHIELYDINDSEDKQPKLIIKYAIPKIEE